jgi:lysophospholipase L1-like esterase
VAEAGIQKTRASTITNHEFRYGRRGLHCSPYHLALKGTLDCILEAIAFQERLPLDSSMNFLRFFCLAGALLLGPLQAAQVKIACVGDSITEGAGLGNAAVESYPARLQRLLGTNAIVRNYGVSGRTLLKKGDFPYWKELFFKQSHDWVPDIVIIQLGTNDSKPQNWKYGTNFISDYEELIASYASLTNSPKVLVCVLPARFTEMALTISGPASSPRILHPMFATFHRG